MCLSGQWAENVTRKAIEKHARGYFTVLPTEQENKELGIDLWVVDKVSKNEFGIQIKARSRVMGIPRLYHLFFSDETQKK